MSETAACSRTTIPVVVLVDGGSASASEIVAAALQEHERATIVGEPTFGKNTVQVWRDLPNGGGLRLTTDRWFTPEHNSVAPDGVQPDVGGRVARGSAGDEDPQLDRAVEILLRELISALVARSSDVRPSAHIYDVGAIRRCSRPRSCGHGAHRAGILGEPRIVRPSANWRNSRSRPSPSSAGQDAAGTARGRRCRR